MILVDHLNEVSNHKGNSLDAFELFFWANLFSSKFYLVFFDVVFLNTEKLEVFVEFLKFVVKVLLIAFVCLWFRMYVLHLDVHHDSNSNIF